jgi:hypothetical protein
MKTKKMMILAAILSVVVLDLNAQEKKPEIPVPVKNLMKFLGKWKADASLIMDGKTYKVDYYVNCKKTADGNGLTADEDFASPDLGTLKGANLAGYDPYDSKIHWFSVDNMGTTHDHVGEWQTPDHLYMEHNSMREGKKFQEKLDFTFNGKDELNFRLVATLDGTEVERGEGVFHRNKEASKK